ncbi:Ferredoxin III 4[4Fe-4S], nif-specific [Magnetospirillum sp. XM-1]|uniref:ferredoxin III, nif-specific n=1 Tax=Magnetospirillum sp. XM-1 TaxID=1663591 RepID=UPI00073DFDFC|nr:ferredoxin III, nif-specific [Magnetospirillum sp. XM-1]CUW41006.1 Ferredoxin III 4[4Fe-4S], nif-specific [Magnetospirillum sp. XM-1]
MSLRTFSTRDGSPWVPKYLTAISDELCIGCGRCFKVCTQAVMKLMGINEDDEMCDPFDDSEEIVRKVMTMDKGGSCIGCGSCNAVCGTNAQTHEAVPA